MTSDRSLGLGACLPDDLSPFRAFRLDSSGRVLKRHSKRLETEAVNRSVRRANRHPIFRSVHPFIMTGPIDRLKLGKDAVGEVLDLFLGGWLPRNPAEC